MGNFTFGISPGSPVGAITAIDEASRKKAQMLQQQMRGNAEVANSAAHKRNDMKLKQIEDKSKEFESVFLSEMLKPMTENLENPAPFNGGFGEKMVQSLLLDEYAKSMTNAGGIGVAADVKRQMLAMQGMDQDSVQAKLPGMEPLYAIPRVSDSAMKPSAPSYSTPQPAEQE
ncbi:hypothetical protein GC177_07100 [bacterium]|nr:hypothetical protein [bacterium]